MNARPKEARTQDYRDGWRDARISAVELLRYAASHSSEAARLYLEMAAGAIGSLKMDPLGDE